MIKFRTWNSVTKEMEQVIQINLKNHYVQTTFNKFRYSYGQPDDVIVEQYTGLKDKNGKEIYEGDILAWHSNIYRKHDWVGLVLYRGAGFAVQESDKSYSSPEWLDCACRKDANIIEVIGNIHENPDLLEADK